MAGMQDLLYQLKIRWHRKAPATSNNNIIKLYFVGPTLKLLLNLSNCFNIPPEYNFFFLRKCDNINKKEMEAVIINFEQETETSQPSTLPSPFSF